MFGFISKRDHDAIVAAKDGHAEGMARRLRLYAAHLKAMRDHNATLEARLAVFTAPRKRDAKGHFLSAKDAKR